MCGKNYRNYTLKTRCPISLFSLYECILILVLVPVLFLFSTCNESPAGMPFASCCIFNSSNRQRQGKSLCGHHIGATHCTFNLRERCVSACSTPQRDQQLLLHATQSRLRMPLQEPSRTGHVLHGTAVRLVRVEEQPKPRVPAPSNSAVSAETQTFNDPINRPFNNHGLRIIHYTRHSCETSVQAKLSMPHKSSHRARVESYTTSDCVQIGVGNPALFCFLLTNIPGTQQQRLCNLHMMHANPAAQSPRSSSHHRTARRIPVAESAPPIRVAII
jgi:hypothetical protein